MKLIIGNGIMKLYPSKIQNDINISLGIIKKDDFNSIEEGIIKTHNGKKLLIAKPDLKDYLMNIKRGPQIITLKDAGFIAVQLGIMPGFRILDCGGGSGAMTLFFANIAGKKGKVVSIEKNEKFCEIIKKNAEMIGFENIEIINSDLNEYSSKKKFDAINLDMLNPWDYADKSWELLKNGARLTIYVPNTTQMVESQKSFEKKGFILEHSFELIMREWDVNDLKCRPSFGSLGHTGFIMCFRKIDLNEKI